jgi:serine/threonine protein kinase
VAVKVLQTSCEVRSRELDSFKQEARVLAGLRHPNIVSLLAACTGAAHTLAQPKEGRAAQGFTNACMPLTFTVACSPAHLTAASSLFLHDPSCLQCPPTSASLRS